jgi:hypothetical protein
MEVIICVLFGFILFTMTLFRVGPAPDGLCFSACRPSIISALFSPF